MKTTITFCLIIFSGLSMVSCKKKIYGCQEKDALNYNPEATISSDNCVYKEDVIVILNQENLIWDGGTWTQPVPFPFVTLSSAAIDSEIITHGIIDGYIRKSGETYWHDIPSTQYSWGSAMNTDTVDLWVNYDVGVYRVYAYCNTLGASDLPLVDLRLVLHK